MHDRSDYRHILLTGGSGRLGTYLRQLLPGIIAPSHAEMDITKPAAIAAALERYTPEVVVHAAAFTDVARAERERAPCWQANVEGTRHLVQALQGSGTMLVHISTDYVFAGTEGMYHEDALQGPTFNYYAMTKLVAEALARLAPRSLVIRSSFRPVVWPYPKAFTDVYTSQDYIDVLAPWIARAIARCREIPYDALHIVTERKTPYELARRRNPDVIPASKREAGVAMPDDISLDASRWQGLLAAWGEG